jgi:hypothetical protein
VLPKNSVLLCIFCGQNYSLKDIHKEMFPAYCGKTLLCKAVHNLGNNRCPYYEDVEAEVRNWFRQHSKDFHVAGFDALVKFCDKCINVDGEYVEK